MLQRILPALLLTSSLFSQKEFEKYGPMGSEVYSDLKIALAKEKKVYKLDMSFQKPEPKLYEKLSKLSDLQALRMVGNDVSEYPKNFEALYNLVYFGSYNNKFTAFPPLRTLQNLHFLEIQHSKIDSIPAHIAYLSRLQTLRIGNTDDTLRLPLTFRFLKSLKEVSFENVVLDSFPRALFQIPKLNYLSLSNTNTQAITKHMERVPELEVLIIENNPISFLPFEIYKAQKLRFISLRGNKIQKLPDSISQLENLTFLDLRGNPISAEEVEKLRYLLPGCEIKF
jgi:Leucine-rich repeat (LRR) protein